jgi:hypothetical protein
VSPFSLLPSRVFFFLPPVREQSATRPLIVISGFIHDVSNFLDEHPGGRHLLVKHIGKDATTAFFGGVYDHSNAAHNVRLFLSIVAFEFIWIALFFSFFFFS